ncbi:MAG: hypothetical protein GY795_04985, partial [Desulfobacterales bacterium]|nr:hypothetical protein [Desulfobacterales bacterium]
NSYHVVTGSMTDSTAALDGFTVTRGNADSGTFPHHDGGGMFTYNGSPAVANCTFAENIAKTNGGGMYNEGASTTVTDCTFIKNSAVLGGGIYNWHGTPAAENCTFTGNTAADSGGGIYSYDSDPVLVNCTFSGNTADSGGGMYIYGSEPEITNCTFAYNTAGSGGGLYLTEKSTLNITNTLVAENQKTDGGYEDFFKDTGSLVNSGYNIVEFSSGHTFSGPGDIGGDQAGLNLGTLDDNGGTTQTCALLTDSVAISGGTDTDAPDTDQRGYPRNAPIDIGAYEYQGKATVKTTGVSSVTAGSASVGGDVVMDGGEEVTERGVCWSTSSISETADPASLSHTTNGTGTGKFSCSLTELISGATYYVRAYATNAVGTAFGSQMSFTTKSVPEVATAGASSVTSESAVTGGTVVSDGGYTADPRGVCWSTSPIPVSSDPLSTDHTRDGTGTGTFRSYLSDLTPGTTYYVRAYAVNDAGFAFGSQISFTTLKTVPTGITTAKAGSVAMVSAVSGGNILSDGGVPITARGVCWSVSENPTVNSARTEDGTGAGAFVSEITDLNAGTTYYVRAYAANSIGTAYGQQVSFTTVTLPSVTTSPVIFVKTASASSGGNVTYEGGADVTARGICWDTQPVQDSADPTEIGHTVNGDRYGSFSSEADGLSPDTGYYVRAYATNSGGTGFGNQIYFKTKPASYPTVTTGETETVTSDSAEIGGNVTYAGGVSLVAKGICWRRSSVPIIEKHDPLESAGGQVGEFSVLLEGLLPETEYVARAYATNEEGLTSYGLEIFFTTASPLGVVTTPVTSVTGTEAFSGGSITGTDGYPIAARGVCWSTSGDPSTDSNDGIATHETTGEGSFTISVTELSPGTTYYLRAYVSSSTKTAYGDTETFTTLAPPAVLTAGVDSVTPVTATVSAEITGDGGESVTARGVCWNTAQEPDKENGAVCTQEGTGVGVFESFIAGLNPHTTHYVRAYAANSAGTSYGNELAFETHVMPGDVNGDNTVDLTDAVLGLKVLAGADTDDAEIHAEADVDGDGKIGMDDILYILRKALSSVTVRGYVSGAGLRIPSARVKIRSESAVAYTDQNGNFTFHISEGEFPEGPDGAVFPIEVTADGYSSGYAKVALFPDRSDYSAEIKLVPVSEEITAEDDLSEGVGIEKDGEKIGELKLPDSALPAGVTQVTGTVTYIDPTTPDIDAFPGGDFLAVTEGGDPNEPVMLESLGLIEFNLEDQDGNRITELDGNATVCMKVPEGLDADVGETIPLWWFNTETGLWVEDGSGTVESRDDGLWMCGSVSHFSWWNYDKPVRYHSCFKFSFVKDSDQSPVTNLKWYAAGITYSGKSAERPCDCDDNDPCNDDDKIISSFTVKKSDNSSEQIRIYTLISGGRYYLKNDGDGTYSFTTDASQAVVLNTPDISGSCIKGENIEQCRFIDGDDGVIPIDLDGFNFAPQIQSMAVSNTAYTNQTIDISARVADSEGDNLSVKWSAECGAFSDQNPAESNNFSVEPGVPSVVNARFIAPKETGKCNITLTAQDSKGNKSKSYENVNIIYRNDKEPPVVLSTKSLENSISITFNDYMDSSTINNETFTMNNGVTGTITYSNKIAVFTPSEPLADNSYTAEITTGAKDLAGNALLSPYTWTFTVSSETEPATFPEITEPIDVNVGRIRDIVAGKHPRAVYAIDSTNQALYFIDTKYQHIFKKVDLPYAKPKLMSYSGKDNHLYINFESFSNIIIYDLNSSSVSEISLPYKYCLDMEVAPELRRIYMLSYDNSSEPGYLSIINMDTKKVLFETSSEDALLALDESRKLLYATAFSKGTDKYSVTGDKLELIQSAGSSGSDICISPDGLHIALGGRDYYTEDLSIRGSWELNRIKYNPDGTVIYGIDVNSYSRDYLYVMDISKYYEIRKLDFPNVDDYTVFTPNSDGSVVVGGSWDIHYFTNIKVPETPPTDTLGKISDMTAGNNPEVVYAIDQNYQALYFINTTSREITETVELPYTQPLAMSYSPADNSLYIITKYSDSIVVYDLDSSLISEIPYTPGRAVNDIEVVPEFRRIYLISFGESFGESFLLIIDMDTGEILSETLIEGMCTSLVIDENNKLIFIAYIDTIYKYSVNGDKPELLQSVDGSGFGCGEIGISPDKSHIVVPCERSAADNFELNDFDAADLNNIMGEWWIPSPKYAKFSPDGTVLYGTGKKNFSADSLFIMDASDYHEIRTLSFPNSDSYSVLTPNTDGSVVVGFSYDEDYEEDYMIYYFTDVKQ